MKQFMMTGICVLLITGLLTGCSAGQKNASIETAQSAPAGEETAATNSSQESVNEAASPAHREGSSETGEKDRFAAEPLAIYMDVQYQSETADDGTMLVSGHYPRIWMGGEDSRYEALSQAITAYTEKLAESNAQEIAQLKADAESGMKDGWWTEGSYYTSELDARVMRSDSTVVSVLVTASSFSGGAHPNYGYQAVNFDSRMGTELELNDVLEDGQLDNLPELLSTKLLEMYPPETFYASAKDLAGTIRTALLDTGKDDAESGGVAWTLGNDGIRFYFAPYEIAPYAAGAQMVMLRYVDNPELVKQEYVAASLDFIEPFMMDVLTTLPGTKAKTLKVSYLPSGSSDEDEYTFTMTLGDNTYTEDIHGYHFDPYLVHKGERNYLYLEVGVESDWKYLKIYDLNGNQIPEAKEFDREFRYESPTDPDQMELATRTDLLSTNGAWRRYTLDAAGMPKETETYDYIQPDLVSSLTTRKDLKAEVRSSEQGAGTEETIAAGTVLNFYATDEESWVDFKDADDRFIRIAVSKNDGVDQIDGVPAEELLDGLMFAG
ncbi:MAG: DUF3298 domain-containing protein [Oribacterium sp.]|nr:DUF3298 domain-containing protein [Oribacterium sp.]